MMSSCKEPSVSLSRKRFNDTFNLPPLSAWRMKWILWWLILNHWDRIRPLERQIISLMCLLSDHVRVLSSLLNELLIIYFYKKALNRKGNKCFSLGTSFQGCTLYRSALWKSFIPTVIRDNWQHSRCSFSGTRHRRLSLLKMPNTFVPACIFL